MPRFYDVDSGRVLVDGVDVREVKLASLRRAIGVIAQDPFLFSTTVRDNIAFGLPDLTDAEIERVARLAQAHEFVERLPQGYDTVIGERGHHALGRAAAADRDCTRPRGRPSHPHPRRRHGLGRRDDGGEDPRGAPRGDEGRTTLIIAHRLSTIALADEIVVLDDGRVGARGTDSELLETSSIYREIHDHGLLEREFADAVEARAEMEEVA